MRNLLILLLVWFSVGVFANDRVLLGAFGQINIESDHFGVESELSSTTFGARLYNFKEEGFYWGSSFFRSSGDVTACASSVCVSGDTTTTVFGGEVGWNIDRWTPFIGASFNTGEIDILDETTTDDSTSLKAGSLLDFENVKLWGALLNIQESEDRSIAGGLLYQMQNNFVVGAEIELLLDDEADGTGFAVYFGRAF